MPPQTLNAGLRSTSQRSDKYLDIGRQLAVGCKAFSGFVGSAWPRLWTGTPAVVLPPLTTQGSAGYAGISLAGILLMAVMAFYGFYTSQGADPFSGLRTQGVSSPWELSICRPVVDLWF